MNSSHYPKYERKNLKISALSIQDRSFLFFFCSCFGQYENFHSEINWPLVVWAAENNCVPSYTEADFEVVKFAFWNFLTCMKIIQSKYVHTTWAEVTRCNFKYILTPLIVKCLETILQNWANTVGLHR